MNNAQTNDAQANHTLSWLPLLQQLLPSAQIKTASEDLNFYGQDWTRKHVPNPSVVVLPKDVDQVKALVEFARAHKIGIVPSGGRTGLSGGAVAANGEMVVAMDLMNQILAFNPIERTLHCQAGAITQAIQDYAEQQGLFYPVDFASSGSSQIGGNISTNAGGIKVIRYGMTRDWVLGLKVVTGAGEILELNQGLIKNNTGYDFRHLFIGAEGTLGLVVEATLALTMPPKDPLVLVLGIEAFDALMQVLSLFQQAVNLEAFEFFSDKALQKVMDTSGVKPPFEERTPYYALLEVQQLNADTQALLMELFERALAQGWVLDGVISQSLQQAKQLWALREQISESIAAFTPYKNDISVSVSKVPGFLADVEALVNASYPSFELVWFGHIGDGNLHLNILKPLDLEKTVFFKQCDAVTEGVCALVQQYGGSISAEHGIGLLKKQFLPYTRTEAEINLMHGIKQVFDPDYIMNPGKIFDVNG